MTLVNERKESVKAVEECLLARLKMTEPGSQSHFVFAREVLAIAVQVQAQVQVQVRVQGLGELW